MKKLLVVVAAICLVGFATSCKKECTCKTTVLGVVGPEQVISEADTKDKCDVLNVDLGELGKTECTWK